MFNSWSIAQENLNRMCVTTLKGNMSVKPGEFQIKSTTVPNAATQSMQSYYDYLYIAQSENSDISNVYVNGKALLYVKYTVRVFRLGNSIDKCVFVVKVLEDNREDIPYGSEVVYAYGKQQIVCDSVVSMFDDGYIYKMRGGYYYSTYKSATEPSVTSKIVFAEPKKYKTTDRDLVDFRTDCGNLSVGDVYHYSERVDDIKGHYYYLYRDELMPYTVLIIDGEIVELFGIYTDENFRLKYSFNGKHWMAVADDYFWVDGAMKSVEGYSISDFLIANNGDYYYKASKKGKEDVSETIVKNGELIRKKANVGLFCLNAQQQLKSHFLSGGQCYVYENGDITRKTDEYRSIYYKDDNIKGQKITITSNDGTNKLSYVNGKAGVEINGEQMTSSVPFQVFFDKINNCFSWNAIEINPQGITELVVYRYSLKK